MKLCVIGDRNDLINATNHKFIRCSEVSALINSKDISECKSVIIQADCHDVVDNDNLRTIMIKLNNIFTKLCVCVVVIIVFKIYSMKCVNNIYDECSMFDALRVVFLSHVKDNDKDKWVAEIRVPDVPNDLSLKKKKKYGADVLDDFLSDGTVRDVIEDMLHLLHYGLEINHKNIVYIPKYGLRCISKYSQNMSLVKKKHIDKIKMDEIMDFTEQSRLINIIEKIIV